MNLPFLHTLSSAFDYVLRASLLGTAAIALVLFIRWTSGGRLAPAARSWLWLPVVLLCLGPQLPGLVDWNFSAEASPEPGKEVSVAEERSPIVVRGEPQPLLEIQIPEPALEVAGSRLSSREKMAVGWGIGSIAILGVWLVAYARLWRRIHCECEPVNERLHAEFQACAAISGVRRVPRLLVSSAMESPAVVGLWRPAVLMPPQLAESLSGEALRHILLHELTHLRRGDLWLHWASALVVALHWFNPFVWLASRKFRGDREAACDATVIAMGESRAHQYGQTLLALESRTSRTLLSPRLMAGVLGSADLVRQRIVDITRIGKTSRRAACSALAMALSGSAVIALAAAEPLMPKENPTAPKKQVDAPDELYTRTFKVKPDFLTWSQAQPVDKEKARRTTALEVLKELGLQFPEGSSATFIPSTSQLIVKNTTANLDFIEAIVHATLNESVRQVHVRSHLVVFKEGTDRLSLFDSPAVPTEEPGASEKPLKEKTGPLIVQHPAFPSGSMALTGVYTDAQFQFLLASLIGKATASPKNPPVGTMRTLKKDLSSKVEAVIGLPSITTSSGHRATLEVAREFVYPTEYDRREPVKQGESAEYVPKKFEMRPIGFLMEIDPVIGPDGYTLDLNLAPELAGFMGWMDAPMADNGKVKGPIFSTDYPTPSTAITIWDGQTVAFGGEAFVASFLLNPSLKGEQALSSKKYPVMVFVTVSLIDPSGQPVKNKEPKAKGNVPPDAAPTPAATGVNAQASGGLFVSRAVVQLVGRRFGSKEPDESSTKAFVESQIPILVGDDLRRRAEKRVRTMHSELSPVEVTLGISRVSETGRVKIEASGTSEIYVRHFLDTLLDEWIALRKETIGKSLDGTVGKMIQEVLAGEKNMQTLARHSDDAIKDGAPKEVVDKLKADLERETERHHVWKKRLEEADEASVLGEQIAILERPSPSKSEEKEPRKANQ